MIPGKLRFFDWKTNIKSKIGGFFLFPLFQEFAQNKGVPEYSTSSSIRNLEIGSSSPL
jgi:hypothetical protein